MRARRERLAESRSEQGFLRGRQQQRISGKLETGWKPSITAQLEPGGPVRTMGPGWQRGDVIAPEEAAERAGLLGDAAKWQRGGDIAQQEQLMLQGQQAYERLFPLLTPAQREAAGTEAQGQAAQAETQKDEAKLAAHKDEQLAAQQDTIPRWLLEKMMGAQQQTAQAGQALAGLQTAPPDAGVRGEMLGRYQLDPEAGQLAETGYRPGDTAGVPAPGGGFDYMPVAPYEAPSAEQQYATRQAPTAPTIRPGVPSDTQHDATGQNLAALGQAQQSLFAGPSYSPLPAEAGPLGAVPAWKEALARRQGEADITATLAGAGKTGAQTGLLKKTTGTAPSYEPTQLESVVKDVAGLPTDLNDYDVAWQVEDYVLPPGVSTIVSAMRGKGLKSERLAKAALSWGQDAKRILDRTRDNPGLLKEAVSKVMLHQAYRSMSPEQRAIVDEVLAPYLQAR